MSEIFSNRINKGSRTYYFDIKKNERDDYFLTITERKKSGESIERHRILVFEEDIFDFVEMFNQTLEELKKISSVYF